jgi:hypothetical protein
MNSTTVLFLIALATVGLAGSQTPSTPLEMGKPVTREINAGEIHSYRVTLEAGQAMHVIVNQLGVDVVLELIDPAAKRVIQVDSPIGPTGPESAWLIASEAGDYGVVVRPFGKTDKGRYEVRLEVRRAATDEDKSRASLQTAIVEADRLRRRRGPDTDRAAIDKLKEVIAQARALKEDGLARTATLWLSTLSTEEALTSMHLSALTGAPSVYYSAGFEQRALALRERFQKGVRFFEKTLGVTPKVAMVVLSRDDWGWIAPIPYPFNFARFIDDAGLVGLPGPEEIANIYIPLMRKSLPAATIQQLDMGGTSFEDGFRSQFNDLVYHELGHVFTSAAGIGTPNLWFGEMMADYLSIAHAAQDPARSGTSKFEEAGLDWLERTIKPKATSLENFDRQWIRLPPDDYAWYHAQFTRRAAKIYQSHGLEFVTQVKAAFPFGEKGPLPVDEVLARLDKIAPGVAQWAASLSQAK